MEELVQMEYDVPLYGGDCFAFQGSGNLRNPGAIPSTCKSNPARAALFNPGKSQYRWLYTPTDEPGRFLAGLKSVEQLRQEANLAPTSQVQMCEVQTDVNPCKHRRLEQSLINLAPFSGEHISDLHKPRVNGAIITLKDGGDL